MHLHYTGISNKLNAIMANLPDTYSEKIRKGMVDASVEMRNRARAEFASHGPGMEKLKEGIRLSKVKVLDSSSFSIVIHAMGKRLNRKNYIFDYQMKADPDYETFKTRFFVGGTKDRYVKSRTITTGGYHKGMKWIPERMVKIRLSKPAFRGRVQCLDSIRRALDEALLAERINNSLNSNK